MIVRLKQNHEEIEVDGLIGNLLIDREYAEAVEPDVPEPIGGPTNYRRPFISEAKDRLERPGLYALRDEIAGNGVPIQAANVLAREIYSLREKIKLAESVGSPHLAHVEKR